MTYQIALNKHTHKYFRKPDHGLSWIFIDLNIQGEPDPTRPLKERGRQNKQATKYGSGSAEQLNSVKTTYYQV